MLNISHPYKCPVSKSAATNRDAVSCASKQLAVDWQAYIVMTETQCSSQLAVCQLKTESKPYGMSILANCKTCTITPLSLPKGRLTSWWQGAKSEQRVIPFCKGHICTPSQSSADCSHSTCFPSVAGTCHASSHQAHIAYASCRSRSWWTHAIGVSWGCHIWNEVPLHLQPWYKFAMVHKHYETNQEGHHISAALLVIKQLSNRTAQVQRSHCNISHNSYCFCRHVCSAQTCTSSWKLSAKDYVGKRW